MWNHLKSSSLSTNCVYNLWYFVSFYTVLLNFLFTLFCRNLRAIAWKKFVPKIVPVEKKLQISSMGNPSYIIMQTTSGNTQTTEEAKVFPSCYDRPKTWKDSLARVTNWNKISLELFEVNHSSTFVVKVWIDSKEVFVETFIDHLIMFYCSFAAVLLQFYGRIPNNAKHIGSFSQLLWPKT